MLWVDLEYDIWYENIRTIKYVLTYYSVRAVVVDAALQKVLINTSFEFEYLPLTTTPLATTITII